MATESFDIAEMSFRSPLHLGQESDGVETIEKICHSDTLFSAICHSWLRLYGEDNLGELLAAFWQAGEDDIEPPFCLSSAFPFITIEGKLVYYLPKPEIPPLNVDYEHPRRAEIDKKLKLLKDIDWITKEFFEAWAAVDKRTSKVEDSLSDLECHYDSVKAESESLDECMKTAIRPRVALDAVSRESRIFFFGVLRFMEGSGLYFLVKWRKADRVVWENKLKAVVKLLGETGLGGERSSGYGAFKPEWNSLEMRLPDRPETANGLITLSLWYPNKNDLTQGIELGQYNLVSRSGWASSPLLKRAYRRKVVTMFNEGSTVERAGVDPFGATRRRITGRLVNVTPERLIDEGGYGHRIYRYGFAFTLPALLPS